MSAQRGSSSKLAYVPLAVSPERGAETALHAALTPAPVPGTWCVPYTAPTSLPSWLRWIMVPIEAAQRLTWAPRYTTSAPESYDTKLASEFWAYAEEAVGLRDAAK